MKKIISILALSFTALLITSCGHSFDGDVKRASEIACGAQKIISKGGSTDEAQEYTAKYAVEVAEIQTRHIKDAEEFGNALQIEFANCK